MDVCPLVLLRLVRIGNVTCSAVFCILVRDDTFDWVDVQHAMKGLEQIFIESEIDEKGIVRGHFQSVMKDESAADNAHNPFDGLISVTS